MPRASWLVVPIVLVAVAAGTSEGAPAAAVPPSSPAVVDLLRRLDVNDLDLALGNDGTIAASGTLPASVYPRGSMLSPLYAGGLWVGAKVGGQPRVSAAHYASDWSPGRILPAGPEPAASAELRNWKVVPLGAFRAAADTGFAAATGTLDPVAHESWSAYVAAAGSRGAPVASIGLPGPGGAVAVAGPDLPGSIALWSVFNDAGRPTLDRLRVEVRQTVFGFPGEGIAFVRWTVRSHAAAVLESTYVALWTDPDLGGPADDLVGWDDNLRMGYVYNATNADFVYGARPPAVGIVFLSGPPGVGPAAFRGTFEDASTHVERYRSLQGLDLEGNEAIDPTTGLPTRFDFPGNPLTATGSVDSIAGEKRMQVSVGPFDLAPGDSATFVFAVVAGRGYGRFESIARLRCTAKAAYAAAGGNFLPPFPASGEECRFLAPRPVTAATWAGWCADPSPLRSGALDLLAALVQGRSRSFAPPFLPLVHHFCEGVSAPGSTARERAEREYLAFLANVVAPGLAFTDPEGGGVGLREWNPVACAGLAATTVGELAERAPPDVPLHVTYVGADVSGQPDLRPVFWGGSAYNGGVGFGEEMFPSALSVANQPDSFPPVEIRFEAASDQKAYRYLRLELAGGGEPPGGREYRYAGYHRVPFRAVDTASGQTLEAAFLERAVVDAAGTLMPPSQQPSTFDSTWSPVDEVQDGGHEILFVLARPSGPAPRPAMEVDGIVAGLAGPPPPVVYVLWLRRNFDDPVIDDGDRLELLRAYVPPSNGVDQRLLALARLPADDPAAIAEYDRIADCLARLNAGVGLPVECATAAPAGVARDTTEVSAGGVRLGWCIGGDAGERFPLARRPANDLARARVPLDPPGWQDLASLLPDAVRRVGHLDPDVLPGEQWTYGLFDPRSPTVPIDLATVTIRGGFSTLSMSAVTPWRNAGARIVFHLVNPGPVTIEVFTVTGRRLARVDLGELEAGPHARNLEPTAAWRPGVVFLRLTQGSESRAAKAVVLR
jgi:hypothetical protein